MARRRGLPLVAALALAAAAAGCGGGSHSASPATTGQQGLCHSVQKPDLKPRHAPRPTHALDPSKTYDVTFQTNCGSFTIRLAVKTSPHVTASFVDLVRRGFFDKTAFHRIIPGFVVQGGDPTGSGLGGPGYTTVDRPARTTGYTPGVVAMAKTNAQAPGTSGSQFFIVIGPAAAQLPPVYAVLGHVVRGMDAVDTIGLLGDPRTGNPTEGVEIERATVSVN